MIIQADILEWPERYDGEPFHAVLCDPPYGLNENEIDIQAIFVDWLADREHRPTGAGFMGREWDSFVPGPRIWRAIRGHCYPGALLMACGGTRTADLLGLALRLGGWEKVDEIAWCYGSGFPKNHNIAKAIDRAAKADRPVVGTRKHQPKFDAAGFEYRKKDNGYNSRGREHFNVTAAATDMARAWEGHGTALKPAHEPILVFRNPFRGTYAANCTRTGAGALNVDGARIGWEPGGMDNQERMSDHDGTIRPRNYQPIPQGRWPANLILDEQAAAALDAQSGMSESKRSERGQINIGQFGGTAGADPNKSGASTERGHDDSGGASRFFQQCDWAYEIEERIAAADPVRYCAKASKSEREAGLDPLQIKLLGMMDIEPSQRTGRTLDGQFAEDFPETTVDDGRQKPIDNAYLRGETKRRNTHPTIKPISLTRYLATLLLPPDAYAPRRILIPFSGAGSEVIGADLAGWEEAIGVELEAQHVAIAQARRAFWRAVRYRLLDPSANLSLNLDLSATDQPTLFDLLPEEAA